MWYFPLEFPLWQIVLIVVTGGLFLVALILCLIKFHRWLVYCECVSGFSISVIGEKFTGWNNGTVSALGQQSYPQLSWFIPSLAPVNLTGQYFHWLEIGRLGISTLCMSVISVRGWCEPGDWPLTFYKARNNQVCCKLSTSSMQVHCQDFL